MKTMRVTLEIDVDNLSPEKLAECAKEMEMSVADLEGLADASAPEVARTLENFGGDLNDDLFAGSDLFVQFADVRVLTAEWLTPGRTLAQQAIEQTIREDGEPHQRRSAGEA